MLPSVLMLLDWAASGVTATETAAEGLHCRAQDTRPHYAPIDHRPHCRAQDNRPNYRNED